MTNDKSGKPYTYEDLVVKVQRYTEALANLKVFSDKVNTHKAAMDSHQRDVDAQQENVDRAKLELKKVLANMEG